MSTLPTAVLGRTGIEVSRLGYGAMELRGIEHFPRLSTAEASTLLNGVLDHGINYIDTSPDYGYSEELLGLIAHRRGEFYLASKCGCPVEAPDTPFEARQPHSFTRENIRAAVEQSLRRMKTDHLDVVQFHHSPSRAVLEAEDSIAELEALRQEGKIRFIGMSGTIPELEEHIDMGVFDVFQVPYSVVERQHEALLERAAARGAGIVVRGGLSRGVMIKSESIIDEYPQFLQAGFRAKRRLWQSARTDDLLQGMPPMEFMLRFVLSHPQVSTTIVGSANLQHVAANVRAAAKGALPRDMLDEARRRFEAAKEPLA